MTDNAIEPSLAAWVEEGRMLRRRKEAATWDLGDWLVRGQGWHLDVGFKRSQRITGYSRSYLHALHSVALAWPICDRQPTLAWSVHKMLLREPDHETRVELMQQAVSHHWNSGDLERHFTENPPPSEYGKHKERSKGIKDRHLRVKCPNCAHEFPMTTHKLPRLALVPSENTDDETAEDVA